MPLKHMKHLKNTLATWIFQACLVEFQNLSYQRFGKPKVGQTNCYRFGKPNVRIWQVLIANQILAKIMACQIFDMANFGRQPIKPFILLPYHAAQSGGWAGRGQHSRGPFWR
jgi:hypothetical protein